MDAANGQPNVDARRAARRRLRFDSIADLRRETAVLAEADRAGRLTSTGNWTLGQAFAHLAFWAGVQYDGYPPMRKPPWLIRVLIPLFKGRFVHGALPVGFRIPGAPGGTYGAEPMSTEEGLARLDRALDRLERQPPPLPNAVLGRLTHGEVIALNLRHAELHLSFQHPEATS